MRGHGLRDGDERRAVPRPVSARRTDPSADHLVGVFEDVARRVPSGWQAEGDSVLLLGTTREELSGSAWADVARRNAERLGLDVEVAGGAGLLAAAPVRRRLGRDEQPDQHADERQQQPAGHAGAALNRAQQAGVASPVDRLRLATLLATLAAPLRDDARALELTPHKNVDDLLRVVPGDGASMAAYTRATRGRAGARSGVRSARAR